MHTPRSQSGWLRSPWTVFLLPFVVYLAVGSFEPARPPDNGEPAAPWLDLGLKYEHYPWIYSATILLTLGAILAVARGYPPRRRIHPLALIVGIAGVIAWLALAHLQRWLVATLEVERLTEWLGGQRPGFNPLEQLGHTPAGFLFLIVRFAGLAAVVPIIEEMFLRRVSDAVFRAARLVECADRCAGPLGHRGGDCVAGFDAPAGGAGGGRVVWRGGVVVDPHEECLGLCGRACRDEFVAGGLRGREW